jgi:hypothetical protein
MLHRRRRRREKINCSTRSFGRLGERVFIGIGEGRRSGGGVWVLIIRRLISFLEHILFILRKRSCCCVFNGRGR